MAASAPLRSMLQHILPWSLLSGAGGFMDRSRRWRRSILNSSPGSVSYRRASAGRWNSGPAVRMAGSGSSACQAPALLSSAGMAGCREVPQPPGGGDDRGYAETLATPKRSLIFGGIQSGSTQGSDWPFWGLSQAYNSKTQVFNHAQGRAFSQVFRSKKAHVLNQGNMGQLGWTKRGSDVLWHLRHPGRAPPDLPLYRRNGIPAWRQRGEWQNM